jgi:hypothetical protein
VTSVYAETLTETVEEKSNSSTAVLPEVPYFADTDESESKEDEIISPFQLSGSYQSGFDVSRNIGTTGFSSSGLNLHVGAWTLSSVTVSSETLRQHLEVDIDPIIADYFFSEPDWYNYIKGSVSRTTTLDEGWWGWSRERFDISNINIYEIDRGRLTLIQHRRQNTYRRLLSWRGLEYDDGLVYNRDTKTLLYRTARYDGTASGVWSTMDVSLDLELLAKEKNKCLPPDSSYRFQTRGYETIRDRLTWSTIGGGSPLNQPSITLSWRNRPIINGVVNVRYLDNLGTEISDSTVLKGETCSRYSTNPKTISGYKLINDPENASGVFSVEPIEVIYVYEKIAEEIGKVTVKHIDKEGASLAEPEIMTGIVGEKYETTDKKIDGYTVSDLPINASGFFTNEDIEVIYIYDKIEEEKGKVTIQYLDRNENYLAESEVITGNLGESYETTAKEITGYTLGDPPINAAGVFEEEEIFVNYVYDLNNVPPLDPLNPGKEVDPENPPVLPEDQGLFSLDFASNFDFGTQVISSKDQTYYAKPQRLLDEDGTVLEGEERPNYVQISDRRPTQDRDGWELSVRQNEQFSGSAGELRGARLVLQNQQIATAQDGMTPGLQHTTPMVLNPGGAKRTLLKAQGPEGEGTWIYRFGNAETAAKSVALEVPKGATPSAASYTTTLTWELSSVPNN